MRLPHKPASLAGTAVVLSLLCGCAQTSVPPVAMGSTASKVSWVVSERPNSSERAGCFAQTIGNEPWSSRIAQATVHVLEPNMTGPGLRNATGFVIRDSVVTPGGTNRIVTAGHVVDDIMGSDGLVEIADSAGNRIGYAAVVARIARNAGITANGRTLVKGDFAVVEMRGFFDGAKARFQAIEGMDLGTTLPSSELQALVSQPAGVVPGSSGSPVVGPDGRVVAIMVGSTTDSATVDKDDMWSANVRMEAADGSWNGMELARMGATREVTLPARSHSYAETLAEPTILAALGPAGARAQNAQHSGWFKDVRVPGYPQGVCIVYHADMKPMGMPFE
jgi:hypothetical protein